MNSTPMPASKQGAVNINVTLGIYILSQIFNPSFVNLVYSLTFNCLD